jgi:hypothetical protein
VRFIFGLFTVKQTICAETPASVTLHKLPMISCGNLDGQSHQRRVQCSGGSWVFKKVGQKFFFLIRSGEANGGESGERELSGKCPAFKFFWKFHGLKSKTGNLKKIIGGFEESAPTECFQNPNFMTIFKVFNIKN